MFQIVDNGTECLVEPCDSWDVLDASGKSIGESLNDRTQWATSIPPNGDDVR